ncbi:MAG: DUF1189 family protein [Ignavibacteriales bacterium]
MGFLIDFKNSVIKASAYRELALRPIRKAVWYLVIIALLTGIPASLNSQQNLSRQLKELIGFQDLVRIEQRLAQDVALFGQDEIALAGPIGQTVSSGFPGVYGIKLLKMDRIAIDSNDTKKLLPHMGAISVIIFILCLMGFAIVKIFAAIVMSLVCLAFAQLKRIQMDFRMCFKVTCYAFTLPLIIQVFRVTLFPTFEHPDLILYGPLIIYQYLAVVVNGRAMEVKS